MFSPSNLPWEPNPWTLINQMQVKLNRKFRKTACGSSGVDLPYPPEYWTVGSRDASQALGPDLRGILGFKTLLVCLVLPFIFLYYTDCLWFVW